LRKFLLVAVLLFAALPAHATIALVQHTNKDAAAATSTTLAYGSNPAANNLLIVAVRSGNGTGSTITCTDTIGNTWTSGTISIDATNGQSEQLCWAVNSTSAADTVTVTLNASATIRMAIYEYSGTATSNPLDVQATGAADSSSVVSASITPTGANELIISAAGFNNTSTVTAGTNFTLEDQVPAAPNTRMAAEDWIQTTATATTGPMSLGNPSPYVSVVAAFKPATSAVPVQNLAIGGKAVMGGAVVAQ
jgi:hypothetical protein